MAFGVWILDFVLLVKDCCFSKKKRVKNMGSEKKHFVLVHGGCLGAWSWYKVATLLGQAGHRVTAFDLAASGINPKQLSELTSIYDYNQPLTDFMTSLPDDEKVILVGHSFGGFNIALASESFFDKILVAVYASADMPNYKSPPATIMEEAFKMNPPQPYSDSTILYEDGPQKTKVPVTLILGPYDTATNLYNRSPPQDLELGLKLVRPCGFYIKDLSKENLLTKEKFGSVKRVYVGSEDDRRIPMNLQKWMIDIYPPDEVKYIAGADHMVMISKPKELYLILQEIAEKYN